MRIEHPRKLNEKFKQNKQNRNHADARKGIKKSQNRRQRKQRGYQIQREMELFYKWISMEGKSISSLSISFVGAVKDNKIFKNIAYIPLLKYFNLLSFLTLF